MLNCLMYANEYYDHKSSHDLRKFILEKKVPSGAWGNGSLHEGYGGINKGVVP